MSLTQIVVIMVIALILFGPEDLPVFARALGKMVYKVRKFAKEVSQEFEGVMDTPKNVVNDVLKEPEKGKGKGTKAAASSQDKSQSGETSEGDEEFLTYDGEKIVDSPESSKEQGEDTNPLSELPADIVTQPNDKQAGE